MSCKTEYAAHPGCAACFYVEQNAGLRKQFCAGPHCLQGRRACVFVREDPAQERNGNKLGAFLRHAQRCNKSVRNL